MVYKVIYLPLVEKKMAAVSKEKMEPYILEALVE
jgi:hypothetical protein